MDRWLGTSIVGIQLDSVAGIPIHPTITLSALLYSVPVYYKEGVTCNRHKGANIYLIFA